MRKEEKIEVKRIDFFTLLLLLIFSFFSSIQTSSSSSFQDTTSATPFWSSPSFEWKCKLCFIKTKFINGKIWIFSPFIPFLLFFINGQLLTFRVLLHQPSFWFFFHSRIYLNRRIRRLLSPSNSGPFGVPLNPTSFDPLCKPLHDPSSPPLNTILFITSIVTANHWTSTDVLFPYFYTSSNCKSFCPSTSSFKPSLLLLLLTPTFRI